MEHITRPPDTICARNNWTLCSFYGFQRKSFKNNTSRRRCYTNECRYIFSQKWEVKKSSLVSKSKCVESESKSCFYGKLCIGFKLLSIKYCVDAIASERNIFCRRGDSILISELDRKRSVFSRIRRNNQENFFSREWKH